MGFRDGITIALGYLSVSFAFGMFAVGEGLSVLEAVMISAFNVTSAGQLAAVPIIAGGGTFLELALTQLIINMRYALMSTSLSQRLGNGVRVRDRFLVAFMNTDEVFAVAMSKETPLGRRYLFALISSPFVGWVLGTLLGAVAGNILPDAVTRALGIAIYAMFIAIIVPAAKQNKNTALCVVLAVAVSCAFYFIPLLKNVPSGFVIIICAVFVSTLMAFVAPLPCDAESESSQEVENV